MPVIKIGTLSFKFSYVIAFASTAIALVHLLIVTLHRESKLKTEADSVVIKIGLFILLLCFGEISSLLMFNIQISDVFLKIIIGYVLMIGSLYLGFNCKKKIGVFVYWVFVINVIVNCILALLGRSAPAILTRLYSIALDTYMDGYYRNGGILGNPNSSLLVMNLLLLFIVLLYKFKHIELSFIKVAFLYVLPIVADIIVSSRGELLHSLLILMYFTFYFIKRNNNIGKFFIRMGFILFIVALTMILLWKPIVKRFPNIQQSLERMTLIGEVMDTSADDAELSSIARPFYKYSTFKERFKYSPLWGTGIDGNGSIDAFIKDTTGYHNDIFMILGATGILGLAIWFFIEKKAIKKIGVCMLFPFLITGLSNTFIQSYFGTMLYFFIIGYFLFNYAEKDCVPQTCPSQKVVVYE